MMSGPFVRLKRKSDEVKIKNVKIFNKVRLEKANIFPLNDLSTKFKYLNNYLIG